MLRPTRLGLFLTAISFFGSSIARADSLSYVWNDRGMPTAILVQKTGQDSPLTYTLNFDSENRFTRSVRAIRKHFPFSDKVAVASSDAQFLGLALNDRFRSALEQIERGGLEYRESSTASEFLAAHPMSLFTANESHELSEKYGAGFVGELFSEWLVDRGNNRAMRARVALGPRDLSLANSWLYLVAPGLSVGNPDQPDRRNPPTETHLIAALRELGLRCEGITDGGFAPVPDNSLIVETRIRSALRAGEHVVILTMSKGTAETTGALARIQQSPEAGATGRIEAVVTLNGLYRGSFIADWAMANPAVALAGNVMSFFAPIFGGGANVIKESNGLTHASIGTWMNAAFSEMAPGSIPTWISVVAIPPNSGLAQESSMQRMQKAIVIPHIADYGPNDGLIEATDEFLPANDVAKRRFELTVSGSHTLNDGQFEAANLATPEGMRALLGGINQTLVDQDW